jgi:hypothetical protein
MNVKDIKEDRLRALSLAGAAIVSTLLDTLVEKNVLPICEVRAILLKAMHGLSPYAQTSVGYEANGMIATIMHDRFPQDRSPPSS